MIRWVGDKRLYARVLELLFFQANSAFVSSGIAGFVLIYTFWGVSENAVLASWALAYSATMVFRLYLARRYAACKSDHKAATTWFVKLSVSVFLAGLIWGLFLFYLAWHAQGALAIILIANIAFLLAGAVTAYAISFPMFIVFSVPVVIPAISYMVVSFGKQGVLLACLSLCWYLFMLSTARRFCEFALRALGYEYENRELVAELEEQNRRAEVLAQELIVLSNTDSLTGLFNRRYFDECLENEVTRAKRSRGALSLILCDVDFFKIYNDKLGHIEGDKCLKAVADILANTVRDGTDIVARFGGEEFGIILTDTDLEQAGAFAERLRLRLRENEIAHPGSAVGEHVTVSIGVSTLLQGANDTGESLVDRTDKALYQAKHSGRDQVKISAE